jgi:predicted 3-demethylubiquinone-9 3-methyltransferase (glyoxalase superfamily)
MTSAVTPFMMFQGNCAEALAFYVAVFPDAQVLELAQYQAGKGATAAMVKSATFSVGGLTLRCHDSLVKHDFSFTPAFSLFRECESEREINRLSAALSQDGAVLMPLGGYGFSRLFTWVNDRFGVSWQLNLAAN